MPKDKHAKKQNHIHGKGIFDPNCTACRGVCTCKEPRPNKKDGYCKECLKDLPACLLAHRKVRVSKKKKILIRASYPTMKDFTRTYGKIIWLETLKRCLENEKSRKHPNKTIMDSIKKDIEIVRRVKPKRKRRR